MRGREELIEELINVQNEAFNLMVAYDSQYHRYGETIIYEAEADILELIGSHPGITVTEMAKILRRTPSACSQVARKLRDKGWVGAKRNPNNNRVCNLTLTEQGQKIYEAYEEEQLGYRRLTIDRLEEFTDEELENHLRVQKGLNELSQLSVDRGREQFHGNIE